MTGRRGYYGGGRPSKGERRVVVTRVATDIADQVAAAAGERGMTISDYLATLLYRDLGIPVAEPEPAAQTQLPLSA